MITFEGNKRWIYIYIVINYENTTLDFLERKLPNLIRKIKNFLLI